MKIILPSSTVETTTVFPLAHIESAGRTCYKSEGFITKESQEKFAKLLLASGHLSVIEHASATVRIICDRGVSHELVRHRLCAFSQESTRYCNYSKDKFGNELTFIKPCFWNRGDAGYDHWVRAMSQAERTYLTLLAGGASPQQARSVLPNSLKTEIVVTANLREWRHIFTMRCDKPAHPQMREIMLPLLGKMRKEVPVIFDDLYETYKGEINE